VNVNELIAEAQNGSTAATEAIIAKYAAAVNKAASRGFGPASKDDKRQAAMVGLLESIQTFDPNRGAAFSTHAHWAMRGAVTVECRVYANCPATNATVRDGDGDETPMTEAYIDPNGETPLEVAERRDILSRAMVGLDNATERERAAFKLFAGLDRDGIERSLTEVGAMLEVSRERARQLVNGARAAMVAAA